jgi:hypothetical protein
MNPVEAKLSVLGLALRKAQLQTLQVGTEVGATRPWRHRAVEAGEGHC